MSLSAVKKNIEATLRTFGALKSSRLIPLSGGNFLYSSGVNSASENWLWLGGKNESSLKEDIDNAAKIFSPLPFVIPVFASLPGAIENYLDAIGLRVRGNFSAMSRDLNKNFCSDGLEIKKVSGNNEGSLWSMVSWCCFDGGADTPKEFTVFAENAVSAPDLELYLGFENGLPAATAMLSRSDESTGLFYLGVRPEMRGRKIGSRMMTSIMKIAKEKCPALTLLATPSGEYLYKKLGFEPLAKIPMRSFEEDIT